MYVPQPDGTRKRKTVYGATWEECDTKRQELVRRDRQGIPTPTRSAKLSEWLPYWLAHYVQPRRKLSTYDKYETHVRLYLVPLLGTKRLESLSVADVRRFITRVQTAHTAATAKEAHRVLRTALTAAVREELITRNVASLVEPPRVKQREIRPWSLEETLSLLEAPRKDPLYAAFVLAIVMGLRRGELVGLRWSDVDLDNRVLHVRHQTQRRRGELYDDDPKSRRSRVVPMPALASLRSAGIGCVSGRRSSARALPGQRVATSSPRGMGVRWNPGTSTDPSPGSRAPLGCEWFGCTTPGMARPRC